MTLTKSDKITIIGIIVASAIAIGGTITYVYLTYNPPHTPIIRSIDVRVNALAVSSIILGPNGSATPGPLPKYGFIFNNGVSHFPVTITNNGTITVYLRQIALTTNNTSGIQTYAIGGDFVPLASGQTRVFLFAVDSHGWQLGRADCTFTVTGDDNLNGKAKITLYVVSFP